MTERNEATERFLLVVIPLCMIVDFGWRLFSHSETGESPSPTVTFLEIACGLAMVICVVWMSVRRLRSTTQPSDGVGAWMVLPVIGLLAGLGLLTLRLNGPSGGGELPPRSTETRPVLPPPSAEERELVQKKALALKAPTGFWDAKWLMSLEEVKRLRPRVTKDTDGDLSETTTWLGRSAKVRYSFKDDRLWLVLVTFWDSATEADFDKTQNHLQSASGNMTSPSKTEKYLLCSTYEEGGFEITHDLTADKTEQVMFSRSSASSRSSAETVPLEFQQMSWQMEALLASFNRARAELEKTRVSRTAGASTSEFGKLSREDLRDHEVKQRAMLDSIDRGIQLLSKPEFGPQIPAFLSMVESRGLKEWKRPDFDLRCWHLLRQMASAGHEGHKIMMENWDEWRSTKSFPPEAEQKPWQKEIGRLFSELKLATKQFEELEKAISNPQQAEFDRLKKELQTVHASFKSRWETLLRTRWAKTESEDPAEGRNYSFATMIAGAVPQLRKLSREDLSEFRQAQRALLDSYEQAFRLFEEVKKTGTDPFNLGVGLTGWYLTEATWKAAHHAHKVAYAQSELVEQNWEDWRRHGLNPKGKQKPWQKKAQQLQDEFDTALKALDASR